MELLLTAPAIATPLAGLDWFHLLYLTLATAGVLFAIAAGVQALWRYVRAKP